MIFFRFPFCLLSKFSRGGERLGMFFRPAVPWMLRSTGDAEAGSGKVEVRCQLVRSRGNGVVRAREGQKGQKRFGLNAGAQKQTSEETRHRGGVQEGNAGGAAGWMQYGRASGVK